MTFQINRPTKCFLTLKAPTPQDGQTHSNSLSATADELFDHFVGLALNGLKVTNMEKIDIQSSTHKVKYILKVSDIRP